MSLRGEKGFTLIELLLAMALFSVIAVAIFSAFRCGITTWRKIQQVGSSYKDARLALDMISMELKNSIAMKDFGLRGTEEELEFFSVLDRYRPGTAAEPVIARIEYFLEPEEGRRTEVLKRRESLCNVKKDATREGEWMGDIKALTFSYAGAETGDEDADDEESDEESDLWKDIWDPENGIPMGVRIDLILVDPETGDETRLVKLVFIPTGSQIKVEREEVEGQTVLK